MGEIADYYKEEYIQERAIERSNKTNSKSKFHNKEVNRLNLYQKIVEVRKIADSFKKDTQGFGYEYVSGNQVLSKIKDKMNELNLLLIPSTRLGEHHTHEYVTSKGKDAIDFVVSGEMSYTWINGDNPEEREVILWAYYGQQDDISKAYGSALTYSERYFLLKCLGLPTDEDDPDSKDTTGKSSGNKTQENSKQPSKEAIKDKYQSLKWDLDKFESWYEDQTKKKKFNHIQIDTFLTNQLNKKWK